MDRKCLPCLKPHGLSHPISSCSPPCLLHLSDADLCSISDMQGMVPPRGLHLLSPLCECSPPNISVTRFLTSFRFVFQYHLPTGDGPPTLSELSPSQPQSSLTPLPCLDFFTSLSPTVITYISLFLFSLVMVCLSLLKCKLSDGRDFCLSCSVLNPHCLKCV